MYIFIKGKQFVSQRIREDDCGLGEYDIMSAGGMQQRSKSHEMG